MMLYNNNRKGLPNNRVIGNNGGQSLLQASRLLHRVPLTNLKKIKIEPKVPPGVYKVIKVKPEKDENGNITTENLEDEELEVIFTNGEYKLVKESENFTNLPPKFYGNMKSAIERMLCTYRNEEASVGALIIGEGGSGKTALGAALGNRFISDFNLPVIRVYNIVGTIGIIDFINSMPESFLFLDEFGKVFTNHIQGKALTMFSDLHKKRRFFFVTENHEYMINEFLKDSPSRLLFRYDYSRLPIGVFNDYLDDMGVNGKFRKDFDKLYSKTTAITFNHVKAIVKQHILFPEDTLEELVEILNVNKLVRPAELRIGKVTNVKTGKEYRVGGTAEPMLLKDFNGGRTSYFTVFPVPDENEKEKEDKDKVDMRMPWQGGRDGKEVKVNMSYISDIPSDETIELAYMDFKILMYKED